LLSKPAACGFCFVNNCYNCYKFAPKLYHIILGRVNNFRVGVFTYEIVCTGRRWRVILRHRIEKGKKMIELLAFVVALGVNFGAIWFLTK